MLRGLEMLRREIIKYGKDGMITLSSDGSKPTLYTDDVLPYLLLYKVIRNCIN